MCNSELRSFERRLGEFRSRDVAVVGISADTSEECRALSQAAAYTFPLLSDRKAETIRAYGLLHAHAGADGRDIARPSEFLLDQAGTIRWENLTESILVRLHPQQALEAIDRLPRP